MCVHGGDEGRIILKWLQKAVGWKYWELKNELINWNYKIFLNSTKIC